MRRLSGAETRCLRAGSKRVATEGQERREDDGNEQFWIDCALVDGGVDDVEELSRVG